MKAKNAIIKGQAPTLPCTRLVRRSISAEEAEYFDPTGSARAKVIALRSATEYNAPACYPDLTPQRCEELEQALIAHLRSLIGTRHAHYADYALSSAAKWAPQGGDVPFTVLEEILTAYYQDLPFAPSLILDTGLSVLKSMIDTQLKLSGPPVVTSELGVTGTFGGIPTCGTKGCFHTETLGMGKLTHTLPSIPGTRYMRGKPRAIFMDACPNVRQLEKPMRAVRTWLKTYLQDYFSAWIRPDLVLCPKVTVGIQRRWDAYCFDYKQMDMHVGLPLVERYVFPVLERLLPYHWVRTEAMITECFSQPLFMGSEMWEGLHQLFSGQTITNDVETILSVEFMLGLVWLLGLETYKSKPHKYFSIFALGDDVTVQGVPELISAIERNITDISQDIGKTSLVLSDEKCARSPASSLIFCRKIYYPAAPRSPEGYLLGAYPSTLCLNNILRPEYPKSPEIEASARMQRLDGLTGSPDWRFMIRLVSDLICPWDDQWTTVPGDWWSRLYGDSWNPASSASIQELHRLIANNQISKRVKRG